MTTTISHRLNVDGYARFDTITLHPWTPPITPGLGWNLDVTIGTSRVRGTICMITVTDRGVTIYVERNVLAADLDAALAEKGGRQ